MLSLMFFTFAGEELYALGKPVVATGDVVSYFGQEGFFLPCEALRTDEEGTFVYVLLSEQGYSRIIHTVSRIALEVDEVDSDLGRFKTTSPDFYVGGKVVVEAEGELADGMRVILAP